MTALDTDSVTQRTATQPNSFDIADIEYFICKKVWAAGNKQAVDTSKIANYDKIAGTFHSGLLTPTSTIAQGTAPHTVGFTSGQNGTDFIRLSNHPHLLDKDFTLASELRNAKRKPVESSSRWIVETRLLFAS